jgi:hypothetical protein
MVRTSMVLTVSVVMENSFKVLGWIAGKFVAHAPKQRIGSESESFSVANGATGEAEVFDDLIGPSMCRALVARNWG